MTMRLNRDAYERLIAENLVWLRAQPRTLEREHVIKIVEHSPIHEYEDAAIRLDDAQRAHEEAIGEMRRQRDALASGIADAALKAGIYNGEASLTGSHVLLLASDMGEEIIRQRAVIDALRAAALRLGGTRCMHTKDCASHADATTACDCYVEDVDALLLLARGNGSMT